MGYNSAAWYVVFVSFCPKQGVPQIGHVHWENHKRRGWEWPMLPHVPGKTWDNGPIQVVDISSVWKWRSPIDICIYLPICCLDFSGNGVAPKSMWAVFKRVSVFHYTHMVILQILSRCFRDHTPGFRAMNIWQNCVRGAFAVFGKFIRSKLPVIHVYI